MRYVDSIKASLVALVLFSAMTWLIPGHGPSNDVELILTVSTFLFAIMAGFFMSRLNTRYDKISEFVAEEDALWRSLYKMGEFFGSEFIKKLTDHMDKYYIVAYDFEPGGCYKHNSKHFLAIYDTFRNSLADISKKIGGLDLVDDFISALTSIEICRNKSVVAASEKMTGGQWTVLYSLSGIILYSLFYLKEASFHSNVAVVLLSTVLVMVLFMLRDLQRLLLVGEFTVDESGQATFDYLRKPRYCNINWLDMGIAKIPKDAKKMRLGLHFPGEEIRLKTVSVEEAKKGARFLAKKYKFNK